jgi:hypothetical protein
MKRATTVHDWSPASSNALSGLKTDSFTVCTENQSQSIVIVIVAHDRTTKQVRRRPMEKKYHEILTSWVVPV